jgi:DNA-binding transcriptional ArsR family regulator
MSDNTKTPDRSQEDSVSHTSDRFDEILNALGDAKRRRIISLLQKNGPVSQREVAHQLVAWEYDSTPEAVPDKAVEKVEIALHHNHLPKLEDAKLIEYDRRSKTLLVRDLPELAELCIDHCESADLHA